MLERRRPLDEAFAEQGRSGALSRLGERDRALARAIAATALRRTGQIDAVFNRFLERPLKGKTGPLMAIVRAALAEILFMDAPAHAVVNLAVHQTRGDRRAKAFAGLVNAVLRKAAAEGPALLAAQDAARLNTPEWLWRSWSADHGEERARALAEANLVEAPLDLTVKAEPEGWAAKLGGTALGSRTVRLAQRGRIEMLAGFGEGQWWVQDAAAALPVQLLGEMAGKRVADLCAAPGGKTAQLAHAGARVTAVDNSGPRLARLRDNLARLGLTAEIVEQAVEDYAPEAPFDAVVLDAPCSATGTIRRHPDIAHLREAADVERLAALQDQLLEKAVSLVKPGGTLVYCVCSLQAEEGEARIARLREAGAPATVSPLASAELAPLAHTLTPEGYARTWPFVQGEALPSDGFFLARLNITGPNR